MTAIGPMVVLGCDGCFAEVSFSADSIDQARVEACENGWAYISGIPDYDYCTVCTHHRFPLGFHKYESRLSPDFWKARS